MLRISSNVFLRFWRQASSYFPGALRAPIPQYWKTGIGRLFSMQSLIIFSSTSGLVGCFLRTERLPFNIPKSFFWSSFLSMLPYFSGIETSDILDCKNGISLGSVHPDWNHRTLSGISPNVVAFRVIHDSSELSRPRSSFGFTFRKLIPCPLSSTVSSSSQTRFLISCLKTHGNTHLGSGKPQRTSQSSENSDRATYFGGMTNREFLLAYPIRFQNFLSNGVSPNWFSSHNFVYMRCKYELRTFSIRDCTEEKWNFEREVWSYFMFPSIPSLSPPNSPHSSPPSSSRPRFRSRPGRSYFDRARRGNISHLSRRWFPPGLWGHFSLRRRYSQ